MNKLTRFAALFVVMALPMLGHAQTSVTALAPEFRETERVDTARVVVLLRINEDGQWEPVLSRVAFIYPYDAAVPRQNRDTLVRTRDFGGEWVTRSHIVNAQAQ